MKYVECDGRHIEVRDVGEVIFRLTAHSIPIKAHGTRLMKDDEARALLRELLDSGFYEGGKVKEDVPCGPEVYGVKLVAE